MSRRGWVLFLAMGVIWGTPYLFIKVAVEHLSPASLVFLRCIAAAALLVPVAAARGQLRPLLPHWRALLAFSAAELAIPWLFLANAERRLSSSLAGLLLAAVPLVGAVLGWITKTDRLDWRRVLGLFIGLGGVAALVGLDLGSGDIFALLQMAVVAIGYAVGPFILARHLADLPGLGVVAASLAITAGVYAIPATYQLPRQWPPGEAIMAVLVLAVVCTAVAFLLFFKLIDEAGPVRATVITYINPAVAIVLGVVFLNEPFTVGIVVGFALVLLGSVLATRRSRPAMVTEPAPALSEP
jgi:drug/metabolite transporter (DMT)-like permease